TPVTGAAGSSPRPSLRKSSTLSSLSPLPLSETHFLSERLLKKRLAKRMQAAQQRRLPIQPVVLEYIREGVEEFLANLMTQFPSENQMCWKEMLQILGRLEIFGDSSGAGSFDIPPDVA
ncbi:unnamed protein product, partial [Amoebophrya sp. A25]